MIDHYPQRAFGEIWMEWPCPLCGQPFFDLMEGCIAATDYYEIRRADPKGLTGSRRPVWHAWRPLAFSDALRLARGLVQRRHRPDDMVRWLGLFMERQVDK